MNIDTHKILIGDENSVTITTVLPSARQINSDTGNLETDEELLKRIARERNGKVVEDTKKNFPWNREVRDAWCLNSKGKLDINFDTVSNMILANVRGQRNAKLAELDVKFMRALERSDTKETEKIAKLKEELRDLPVKVEKELQTIIKAKGTTKKKLDTLLKFKVDILQAE